MLSSNIRSTIQFYKHLRGRGLSNHIPHYLGLEDETCTFPLWHGTKLIGYQKYSWREEKLRINHGKYFTWIQENYKPLGVWGFEFIHRPGPLFICEGIWDTIRVINAGFAGLAIFTATPAKQLVRWLPMVVGDRKIIGIIDNDENNAGKGLVKLCDIWYTVPVGKDLNELSQEDANTFLREIVNGRRL